MKKSIALLLACWCALCLFRAPTVRAAANTIILTSTFPLYQLTRNIVRDIEGAEVRLMLPAQLGCPHNYVLTPQDMTRLAQAQILIINGLGMEPFLDIPALTGPGAPQIIDSSQGVPAELLLRQEKDEEDQRDDAVNPHLFASPRMAALLTEYIARELARIQPEHGDAYQANGTAYVQRLNRLADDFAGLGERVRNPRIVTQHGVFDYLARDAALEVTAVMQAHDGKNPSAAEIMSLVITIRKHKVGALCTEPQYPEALGQILAREADVPVIQLDPVASGPDQAPLDYYERTMTNNLQVLTQTLGLR
ncbi:MAG: metal ABC transporter substrate-binding protein [Desulfobulbus sp.]|jgi:zinc transport system substrate-binding protein